MRTIYYIDGFNFYYGLKKSINQIHPEWRAFYWIDFLKFANQFALPGETIEKVKYFTSPPLNSGKKSRQSALFKANDLINKDRFEVIRGKYYDKEIVCSNCATKFTKPEEKRTDVNISVNMVGDCALGLVDKIVLISADSDLVPPIEFIKKHFPNIDIKIFFPPGNFSYDLKDVAKGKKVVRLEQNNFRFRNSIMPDEVFNHDKTDSAKIPPEWK
ncbi:NYN domain-containing protein [Flavobacterium sp. CYK-55]|uniref:NYN domain-containing protein n=1 Tax=Flavobacterium sp. CYK-55 TaxID=2835529 RepID=UPI001BCB4745|nr:NYN domain-containing protein [Flavobacterium sp. CYK-55]MBS7787862.1 NYN domain-containing protein [Flavobacterium sp. CYK-55]